MAKQSDFDKFLNNIEPSQSTVSYISSVQNTLRDYLKKHKVYVDIYVSDYPEAEKDCEGSADPVSGTIQAAAEFDAVRFYFQS